MGLRIGTQLGPYEILSAIGAGGMGEVYRARDTRLNRDVALKVLPEAFAADPDRMARFEREARVLGALNHPNIAAIYGLEELGSGRALVMEMVEGPTLADRIARGPISIDEALPIAKQLSEALEYAHDRGVIHRDLKPANIKVTADDTVKVLDFGLAKALMDEPVAADPRDSPTLSMAPTMTGVILGTAAYMSPEQAKGKPVDRRADIWAFGAVLFEMLTGKPLYSGETAAETLASVMKDEPALEALPKNTPPAIRILLRRCLEKNLRQRLQHIGEARIMIEGVVSGITPAESGTVAAPHQQHIGWIAATFVLLLALVALSFIHLRQATPQPQPIVRFLVPPPEKSVVSFFQLSPNGRYLAFTAQKEGRLLLWVRALDTLEAQPLPGTDDASYPFWSPDSAFIGFFAQRKLKKIAVVGGPPQALCDAPNTRGGTWNHEGTILFSPNGVGLYRVPAGGGIPEPVTKISITAPGEFRRFPSFLPGGRRFLYTVTIGKPENVGIYVGSLDGEGPVRILPDVSSAAYVPPDAFGQGGLLLFRREETLMAQPFDPARVRRTGDMFPVGREVGIIGTFTLFAPGTFSASENGVLAYGSGTAAANQQLVWVDRTGKQVKVVGSPGVYRNFRLAPDEKTIVMDRNDIQSSNIDVWKMDTDRGVTSRLTFDPATDNLPIWSPDGLRILWPSNRNGLFDLYTKAATGAGQDELLIKLGTPTGWGTDWSRDGRFIIYQVPGARTGQELWIAPQFGDRKPFPYLQNQFNEADGRFSPDGRWIAYISDESGRDEVYVQSFPQSGGKWQISTGGGSEPNWRKGGTELFYAAADGNLMAVPVKIGSTFEAGAPKPLFAIPLKAAQRSYAVANDGQRFLIPTVVGGEPAPPITVVLNWTAGLKK